MKKKTIGAITAVVATLGFSLFTQSYAADQKTMGTMEPSTTTMTAGTMDKGAMDKGTMTNTANEKMMTSMDGKKDAMHKTMAGKKDTKTQTMKKKEASMHNKMMKKPMATTTDAKMMAPMEMKKDM